MKSMLCSQREFYITNTHTKRYIRIYTCSTWKILYHIYLHSQMERERKRKAIRIIWIYTSIWKRHIYDTRFKQAGLDEGIFHEGVTASLRFFQIENYEKLLSLSGKYIFLKGNSTPDL